VGPDYAAGAVFGPVKLLNSTISDDNGYMQYAGSRLNNGFGGACGNCSEVSGSTFHGGWAACFSVYACHDSQFYGITQNTAANVAGVHTQVVEDDGGGGGERVYNNIIHDNHPVGVTIYQCATASIYNNVLWNNSNRQIAVSGACHDNSSGAVLNVYNNTVDCSNGTPCFGTDVKGTLLGTVNLKNNHWITNGAPVNNSSLITTFNQSNNLTMNTSMAASQGYSSANAYKPMTSTGGTVNAAISLSTLCSSALQSLCEDRLHNPRLTSWDAGAYEFGAQSSSKPNQPTSLTAIVQ
jgi:hypothetical protein